MNKSRPPGKLKQRVLTALVLLPLIVAAMIYLPSLWLGVVLGMFILVGAWEWAALSGLEALPHRIIYVVLLGIVTGITSVGIWYFPALAIAIIAVAAIWWVWAFFDLVRRAEGSSGMFHSMIGRLVGGAFVLIPAWLAAIYLHRIDPLSPAVLLFFFALVWIADTSAYFAGRTWGKTRLAPRVSPGKTVEGLFGAIVAVILLAYFCGVIIWGLQGLNLFAWIVVAVCASFFSVLGDLVESKLKRLAGAKNSGHWLPGHGGVLDRIDAMTAAAPVFALGWMLLQGMKA